MSKTRTSLEFIPRTTLESIKISCEYIPAVSSCISLGSKIANIGIVVCWYGYPYFIVVDGRKRYEAKSIVGMFVGIIAYVIYIVKNWEVESKATSTIFGEYYLACKKQYTLEHQKDPDAWRRDLDREFYDIHIKQEKEKIEISSNISDIVSEDDAILLSNYANEYLEYVKRRIEEERGQKDDIIEMPPQPKQQETDRGMLPEVNNALLDESLVIHARGRRSRPFNDFIINGICNLDALHKAISNKTGREVALIIQAAIRKGWITKPTYNSVVSEFGNVGHRSNFNRYLNGKSFTDVEIEGAMAILDKL